ncbi:MAG: PRC-barrel domain-containing protein [Solirubrobacteraceae bacterium]
MLNVERIHEWRGQDVLDADGERIGKLDEVYYDAASGEAAFASVKSGLMGRRSNLVPLAGATVGRDYVRISHPATVVDRAEAGEQEGLLDAAAVRGATEAYGIEISPDASFESATLITERQARAQEAVHRAEELEHDAREQGDTVKAAQRSAEDAERELVEAQQELVERQRAADDARKAADDAQAGTATQRRRET